MAIFKMKHEKDYTVMSDHHLRNLALSLKAKGLLSQMLALPDDWDHSIAGLAYISREGERAVRSVIKLGTSNGGKKGTRQARSWTMSTWSMSSHHAETQRWIIRQWAVHRRKPARN